MVTVRWCGVAMPGSGSPADLPEFLCVEAAEADHLCAGAALPNRLHPHRLAEERAVHDLPLNERLDELPWLGTWVRHCGPAPQGHLAHQWLQHGFSAIRSCFDEGLGCGLYIGLPCQSPPFSPQEKKMLKATR